MDMEMKNCVQAECTAFEMNRMLKDLRNVNFVSDISDKVDKLNKMAESLCVYVIDGGEVTDEAKDAIIGTFLLLHNKKRIPNRVAWELVNMEYYLAKMKESFEQQEKVVKVSPITLELVYERAIRDLDIIKIEKALDDILKEKLGAVIDGEYIEYSTGYNYKNKKKITEQIYVDLVQICNSPRNSKRGNNNLFLEIVKKWSENVIRATEQGYDLLGIQTKDIPKNEIKRGRPKKTIMDNLLVKNKEEVLKDIHKIAAGKRGKVIALIFLECVYLGIMTKPTYGEVKNEFGDIGNRSNYNKYMKETMHSEEDIKGMRARLKQLNLER